MSAFHLAKRNSVDNTNTTTSVITDTDDRKEKGGGDACTMR